MPWAEEKNEELWHFCLVFASLHQEPVKYLKVTVSYPIIKQAKMLFLNKVRMTYEVFKKCQSMFQAGSLKRI